MSTTDHAPLTREISLRLPAGTYAQAEEIAQLMALVSADEAIEEAESVLYVALHLGLDEMLARYRGIAANEERLAWHQRLRAAMSQRPAQAEGLT